MANKERQPLVSNQPQPQIIPPINLDPPPYPAASIISIGKSPQYNPSYQGKWQNAHFDTRDATVNPENTDAYIYFAIAIILSTLVSLTGIGAVFLVCTIPAILNAKDAVTAGEVRRHDLKKVKIAVARTYILCSCCMGSCAIFLFGARIVTLNLFPGIL